LSLLIAGGFTRLRSADPRLLDEAEEAEGPLRISLRGETDEPSLNPERVSLAFATRW
jgi:hypothetical protein